MYVSSVDDMRGCPKEVCRRAYTKGDLIGRKERIELGKELEYKTAVWPYL